jgi:hypothetical protein
VDNRSERGLFTTWIRGAEQRTDIDAAVNANVVLYLGECEATRSACDALVEIVNESREAESCWYYEGDMPLYYFVSRAFRNGLTSLERSCDAIVAKVESAPQTDSLVAALAICTLLNFGVADRRILGDSAARIVQDQRPDGSWPRAAFMRNAGPTLMARRPPMLYSGSEELTTAFCIEALSRFEARKPASAEPA